MSDIKLACTVVEQVKAICDIHGNTPGELISMVTCPKRCNVL